MTLSKQLYIIISFIFLMIFTGNFIISVNNFKEYLQVESTTKSQDTATSLGMSLKSLIDDKTDAEITSIIRAIANRGFYKEIRLEDIDFVFTSSDLLNKKLSGYKIKDISIDKDDGEIISSKADDELENELLELDGNLDDIDENINKPIKYSFFPSTLFPNKGKLKVNFIAYNDTQEIKSFKEITINKVLVSVKRDEKFDTVPQWFINALPLTMTEAKSEISNGWTTKAIIYVSANAGEAYKKLYSQTKKIIYYSMISFVISIFILIIFLQFILKPLKDIEILAKNISQGNFNIIKKLPWTTEIKNISISMNEMSEKIKNMINKLNNNLEKMTNQLSNDDLTGLQLQPTFQTDMKQMFIKKEDGYIFSIKINNLADFAKHNSHNEVDKLLKDFSEILKNIDKNILAYRFFGSTFALISKDIEHKNIELLTNKLKDKFDKLSTKYNITNIANIGVTPFNQISTTNDILALANEAYEMAKQIGSNEAYIRDKNDLARDMLEWKELIFDIIDNHKFEVGYINQAISMDNNKKILLEEAFTSAIDKDNKPIAIGTFISIAQEYDKVIDFDKAVILQVINHIKKTKIVHEILINLTFESLFDSNFTHWLENILKENNHLSNQLVFSMTAYGCKRDILVFKEFINLIHQNGAKIILKRFETKFIPLNDLKEFNLDYIRLARNYTNDIANDNSKQNFVESICELSKLLNIQVFAESVKNDENFKTLKSLGIDGASM